MTSNRHLDFKANKLQKALFLLASAVTSLANAQPFQPEPGALYPANGSEDIRYLVPVGKPPIPANIRAVFSKRVVDFDTGKPIGIDNQALLNAPTILGDPLNVNGPIKDVNGIPYYGYWCGSTCVWSFNRHGKIGADYLRLDSVDIVPASLRNAMSGSLLSRPGTSLSNLRAYQGLVYGKPRWAKVYLVQTLGTYVVEGRTTEEIGENVVLFSTVLEALLPGDKYFYLTVGDPGGNDWAALLRINLFTGLPLTKHPRVKAAELSDIKAIFEDVIVRVRQHYPTLNEELKCSAANCPFVARPEDAHDTFQWAGLLYDDAAELTNHLISQHYFKGLIK